jgi:predicted secreted protein
MSIDNMAVELTLASLMERANSSELTPIRLNGWQKVVEWNVDGSSYFWVSDGTCFIPADPIQADFVLQCSAETLQRIEDGRLPFFIGLWGTGDITFEGSFSDAYRLGYIFLSDIRKRSVIFISHCWLNINTRFPEGCAFEGANVPLIKTLLDSGLGIIQMPCPEYECLGLEKWRYGELAGEDLQAGFRKVAGTVAKQIKDYLALGFHIAGVFGMDPSPSCGVNAAKGKGTMFGSSRDISEKPESGIFIEELQRLLQQEGIPGIRFFAVRRTLIGESGLEEKIEALKTYIRPM